MGKKCTDFSYESFLLHLVKLCYEKLAYNLSINRNSPTFQDLAAAYEAEDIDKFTEALMDYDSLSPLVSPFPF